MQTLMTRIKDVEHGREKRGEEAAERGQADGGQELRRGGMKMNCQAGENSNEFNSKLTNNG